jgi:hypothetical protein
VGGVRGVCDERPQLLAAGKKHDCLIYAYVLLQSRKGSWNLIIALEPYYCSHGKKGDAFVATRRMVKNHVAANTENRCK